MLTIEEEEQTGMSYLVGMVRIHSSELDTPGCTKDGGGMNVYMCQLAQELGHRGIAVDIFTRLTNENTPRIVQLSQNVRVLHIKAGPLAKLHKNDLYQYVPIFAQRIEEWAERESQHYDVLHSHYWVSGIAAMWLAGRWDIPHVTMFHTLARLKQLANPGEPELQLRLDLEQRLIQQADRIIAATVDERTQLVRSCGAIASHVQIIPCGVDLKLFVPHNRQRARLLLGLHPTRPVLLFAGRLDPFKGPDLLLRATAMMENDAQMVIVGGKLQEDKELQQLRALAAELSISQRVRFLGARPQIELPLLYSAADITVVPSYHESFGMVAVESLACGTPVVATRAGGLTTVVRHGETGYLVPRSPGFFAERLDTLLRNPALLEKMRAAARSSILQFSWKSVATQIHDLYDEMVEESQYVAAQ